MVYSSVMGSDIESRKTLFGNIILSGGPTLSPGIDLRLSKSVTLSIHHNFCSFVFLSPNSSLLCFRFFFVCLSIYFFLEKSLHWLLHQQKLEL